MTELRTVVCIVSQQIISVLTAVDSTTSTRGCLFEPASVVVYNEFQDVNLLVTAVGSLASTVGWPSKVMTVLMYKGCPGVVSTVVGMEVGSTVSTDSVRLFAPVVVVYSKLPLVIVFVLFSWIPRAGLLIVDVPP